MTQTQLDLDLPTFAPTLEQDAILDTIATTKSNLMIRAYAGCGKTSTLALIDAASPGPTLYLCFNKDMAAKASLRSTTQVRTFNALGHRLWASRCAHKVTLFPNKIREIFSAMGSELARNARIEHWRRWDIVSEAVALARNIGYIPEDHAKAPNALVGPEALVEGLSEQPDALACQIIDTVLLESIRQAYAGSIDFADQCYMPTLFGASWPRFPLVLVDEYQDLSPVNLRMVAKLTVSGRLVGVGDEAQAIYGFRGAADNAMSLTISCKEMTVLPLSTSFRCPERIVRNVRWRVPLMKASRPGGAVRTRLALPYETSAVLCRNNAPLITMAMRCAREGIHINLAGVDILPKLIRTLKKFGSEDLTRTEVESAIHRWESARIEAGSTTATDLAQSMLSLAAQGSTLAHALAYATSLAPTDPTAGSIIFSTGHRAKGLEWPHVVHLDSVLCTDEDQDPNIRYVIDTRASESLTYMNSEPK